MRIKGRACLKHSVDLCSCSHFLLDLVSDFWPALLRVALEYWLT